MSSSSFITGSEVEGVHVLDQCAEFAHQRRTRLGRRGRHALDAQPADQARTVRAQIPGPLSQPSGQRPGCDASLGNRRKLPAPARKGGHLALMAIFSRDGFVRFMRLDQEL